MTFVDSHCKVHHLLKLFFSHSFVSFNLNELLFIFTIYALCVSLSTMAAVRTGFLNISCHLSNDCLIVIIVDF